LNKLERQNLLSGQLRVGDHVPARKIYQITEAGRGVLQTAVADLLRQPRALGDGFELGLANLSALQPRQVYKVLSLHLVDLKQRLELVEQSWERHQGAEDDTAPDHIRALYTHSIAIMQAELTWMDNFLTDWIQRYPQVKNEEVASTGASSQVTRRLRQTTPDPVKQIQRLRRPMPPHDE
jgi:DNA-binding PadR family transcriptional regulator